MSVIEDPRLTNEELERVQAQIADQFPDDDPNDLIDPEFGTRGDAIKLGLDPDAYSERPDIEPLTFADVDSVYGGKGWRSVLPLPQGQKYPPPTGFTGAARRVPNDADRHEWADRVGNFALAMPDQILGIDVDAYDGKRGAETLAELEAELGPLPDTWRSSSRPGDDVSGIRFFAVPTGLHFKDPGGDIELVQYAHRYAVVAPSIHPKTGLPYHWYQPGEVEPELFGADGIPDATDIAQMPMRWIERFTDDERGTLIGGESPATDAEVADWLDDTDNRLTGADDYWRKYCADQFAKGSRHDAMVSALAHLKKTGDERPGYRRREAFGIIADQFRTAIDGERNADIEIAKAMAWTIANVKGDPEPPSGVDASTGEIVATDREVSTRDSASADADLEVIEPSWRPQSKSEALEAIRNGTATSQPTEILARGDGLHLLYRGKVHMFFGESESGKSILAMAAVKESLERGERVVYVDYEDDLLACLQRLTAFGVPSDLLDDGGGFEYVRPENAVGTTDKFSQERFAMLELAQSGPALVIHDGVTEAMTTEGLDPMSGQSNPDFATWLRTVVRPFTVNGSAVVVIDHTSKSNGDSGPTAIGGQHKKAGLDGASFFVEAIVQPRPAKLDPVHGRVRIRLVKDRPGSIRRQLDDGSRLAHVADLHVDAYPDGGTTLSLVKPGDSDPVAGDSIERRIAEHIYLQPDRRILSKRSLASGVGMHETSSVIGPVLDGMVTGKYLLPFKAPRNATGYQLTEKAIEFLVSDEVKQALDDLAAESDHDE